MVAQNQYSQARETFLSFKNGLEVQREILDELLGAMRILVADYNTTYRENRFIVGGAVEEMIAASMRCAGLTEARAVGIEEVGHDIRVGRVAFSLKTSFTGKNEAIGMINKQGGGTPTWHTPTIFVLTNAGIGYADPALLPNATRDRSDQIALPRDPLYRFFENNPQWRLQCNVPVKPPTDQPPQSVASKAVADEILQRQEDGEPLFPSLSGSI